MMMMIWWWWWMMINNDNENKLSRECWLVNSLLFVFDLKLDNELLYLKTQLWILRGSTKRHRFLLQQALLKETAREVPWSFEMATYASMPQLPIAIAKCYCECSMMILIDTFFASWSRRVWQYMRWWHRLPQSARLWAWSIHSPKCLVRRSIPMRCWVVVGS